MTWALDARLEADSHHVLDLPLSQVRLFDNAHVPWLVLVPRVAGAVEWIDLDADSRHVLLDEVSAVSEAVRTLRHPHKVNIGALGNIVRQLHVHVVGRFETDPAWPGPVWGAMPARPYTTAECTSELQAWRVALDAN
jgi:diadenosine tetraphosphate (Ap4A) HIT family hydrolase